MTTCASVRNELIDHALGRPAGAALSAHLHACAGCAAALADRRAQLDRVDAGVRALVQREASPNLRARVLTALDSAPPPFAWRRQLRTAAIGAILIVSALAVTHSFNSFNKDGARPTAVTAAVAALSHWRAPTDVLLPIR